MLNSDLLFQRMTRGALTGPAEQEKEPMKRCTGKLENGRQCAVVPLTGDMCTACQKRGAEIYVKEIKPPQVHNTVTEKKRGRPAKKGATPDHVAELLEMVEPAQTERKLADAIIDAGSHTTIGYDSEQEKAGLAGAAIPADVNDQPDPDSAMEMFDDLRDLQILPVEAAPPPRAGRPLTSSRIGAAAPTEACDTADPSAFPHRNRARLRRVRVCSYPVGERHPSGVQGSHPHADRRRARQGCEGRGSARKESTGRGLR